MKLSINLGGWNMFGYGFKKRRYLSLRRPLRKPTKHKRERVIRSMNNEANNENVLLKQIDEFREKAKQLQSLISSKENKVAQLQDIVEEREGKARELESILNEKQEQADEITNSVEAKIETLISMVDAKLDELSKNNDDIVEKQKSNIDELAEKIAGNKKDVAEKIHTENVKSFRNMQVCVNELSEKIDNLTQNVSEKKTGFGLGIVTFIISIVNLAGIVFLVLSYLNII